MNKKHYIAVILIALVISLAFQLSNTSLHDDGWFYSKMAQLFWQQGLQENLPWLHFSTPANIFSGNHFLFYVLASPLVALHPVWGLKILTVLGFALMSLVFFKLLFDGLGAKTAWLGTFFLWFGSYDFLYRMNLNRPLNLVLAAILALSFFMLKKRTVMVFFTSLVFVWLYDGFLLIPLLFVVLAVACLLAKRPIPWRSGAGLAGGLACGIVTHPYFPANILSPHLASVNFLANLPIMNSREWLPPNHSFLTIASDLVLILFALSLLAFILRKQGRSVEQWYFLLLASGSILLMFMAVRFMDFAVPFVMASAAFIIAPTLPGLPWQKIRSEFLREHMVWFPFAVFVIVILTSVFSTVILVTRGEAAENNIPDFSFASAALLTKARPGEIVFNAQWDHFPRLFFWNDLNYYIAGLNPLFLFRQGEEKYWLWRHISDDELLTCPAQFCNQPKAAQTVYQTLKNDFSASYVFLENSRNPNLKKYLDKSADFQNIYQDEKTSLFIVR